MNPLALLPYALAAAGGRVGSHSANALTTAGLTLLQRSAPLVRLLAGRQAGALLTLPHQWVVAFAASDGRALVGLDPQASKQLLATQCTTHGVGAVFTTAALASRLPDDMPRVLLDGAPRDALVHGAGAAPVTLDLGTHFALELVGTQDDDDSAGAADRCYVEAASGASLTHRDLLQQARSAGVLASHAADSVNGSPPWHRPPCLVSVLLAPLLRGDTVLLHGDAEHASA